MSMRTSPFSNGYSAVVQLFANIEGRTLRLSHVGPNEIILIDAIAINPGPISVEVVIDDHRQTYYAEIISFLPAGTSRVPVNYIHLNKTPATNN